ncbi:hypothetical protein [Moorena sp. SIO4G3]|nr:hypothetical protein [Moorena sp. SIO4G3]NEO77959.1 hypothetical protein [Moorena sp. SIO4G3]
MGRRGRKSEAFRGWCVTGRSVYGAKRPKIRGFPWVVRYGTVCLWGEEAENQRLSVPNAPYAPYALYSLFPVPCSLFPIFSLLPIPFTICH